MLSQGTAKAGINNEVLLGVEQRCIFGAERDPVRVLAVKKNMQLILNRWGSY